MRGLARALALCAAIVAAVARADDDDEMDFTLQGPEGSQICRLLITIDGKPLSTLWRPWFTRFFDFLDRDGDGMLSAAEASRVPSVAWLKAQWHGDFDNVPTPFVPLGTLDKPPQDNRVSRAEFSSYYYDLERPELHPGRAVNALDDHSARRLFELLAGGADAVVNEAKLRTASEKLRRYDLNDDERWTAAELKSPDQAKPSNEKQLDATPQHVRLSSNLHEKVSIVKIELQTRGGKTGEIRVTRDKTLTSDLDWSKIAPAPRADTALLVERGMITQFSIVPGGTSEAFQSASQSLLQQFESDDLDRDQAIDAAEAKKSAFSGTFNALLTVGDRNNDGKLSAAELQEYLQLQSVAAGQLVVLGVANHGVPLFELLDANGDGTLTLRELYGSWSRINLWSLRLGTDPLTWSDLPHKYEWTISLGLPKSTPVQRLSQPMQRDPAPSWFTKMDRNNDGDLSRREFLGDASEFRRLDKDGDGLVSPEEASK